MSLLKSGSLSHNLSAHRCSYLRGLHHGTSGSHTRCHPVHASARALPSLSRPRGSAPFHPFGTCQQQISSTRQSTSLHAYSSGWSPRGASNTGPYRMAELDPITLQLGYNNGSPVSMQLEVYYPAGVRKAPLAIISAGFLLNGSLYRSYAEELARWGYVTVLYDLSELFDDLTTVNHLRSVIDFSVTDPRLSQLVDSNTVYLIGHSRGGKLSCLTAARDERVKALCLFDPVDVTPMTPPGPGYPSCLSGLRNITSPRGRCVPVLVVGAGRNGDVIPASGNYKRFTSNCLGPCWEVDLLDAGHLQFLDRQVPLLTAFSAPGPTPDATVRQVSCSAMVAWGEKLVRPRQLQQPVAVQDLQEFLQQEGDMLQQLAPAQMTVNNLHTLQFASWQQEARRATNSNTSTARGNNNGGGYSSSSASPGSTYTNGTNSYSSSSSGGGTDSRYSQSMSGFSGNAASSSYGAASSGGYGAASSSGYSARDFDGGDGQGRKGGYGSDPFSSNSAEGDFGGRGAGFSNDASRGASAGRYEPVSESYDELMKRRARELKDMLVQRGIDCSDCYEKSELARRLVERAGVKAGGRY